MATLAPVQGFGGSTPLTSTPAGSSPLATMASGLAGSFASSFLKGGSGGGGSTPDVTTSSVAAPYYGGDTGTKRNVIEGSREFYNAPVFGNNPFFGSSGLSGINYNLLIWGGVGLAALLIFLKFKR